MDSTVLIVVVAILALIAVAAFSVYRRRGDLEIKLPFGISFSFGGSGEDAAKRRAVEGADIVSREGGVYAEDKTGDGVRLQRVDARDDVMMSSEGPGQESPPKEEPPA